MKRDNDLVDLAHALIELLLQGQPETRRFTTLVVLDIVDLLELLNLLENRLNLPEG